jgi:hypothetical protein
VKRRSVFVLIDALGWDVVSETGFLPELSGTRAGLRAVLGYSGACQAAMYSGLSPSESGHWLMYYFTKKTTTFRETRLLRHLPVSVRNRGPVRRWLRRRIESEPRIRGYYGMYDIPIDVFPYLEVGEKNDLYAPGGLAPARGIFDDLEERSAERGYSVWDWRVPEADGLEALLAQLREDRKGFYLIYWTWLDALMHSHGTRSDPAREHMRWYEAAVRRILETAAGLDGETRVFVFSDHGMMDTDGTVDLMSPVARLGLRYGRDYVAFYDSTLARFSFFSERARCRLLEVLGDTDCGDILEDDELRKLGLLFPDRRFGEVVYLTRPGTQIAPSYMGRTAPRAMHGFHPDTQGSQAHLISNVEVDGRPESLRDLYAIMRKELDG